MVNASFSLITFEYFLLVLVRITTFVFAAPFFNMANVPRRVKVGFSALVALMVMDVLSPQESVTYTSAIGYGVLVLKEGITGLLIGYAANICNSIVLFAGNIIDMDIGLSMAQEFNPILNTETTLTGEYYFYGVNFLLIVTNMYQYLIRAVIDSFQVVPLGGAKFDMNTLLSAMTGYFTSLFIIAFRIMLPVFACTMILNCVLGIMAKVAPQMNMFSVGVQLKMLLGFAVIFITVFLLPDVANFVFKEMKIMMVSFIKGMY